MFEVSMPQKLYEKLIAPKQTNEDARNREYVLNILLVGTGIVILLALFVLLFNFFVGGKQYVAPRIGSTLGMLAVVGTIYGLSRAGKLKAAAYSLVILYCLIGIGVGVAWGVTMPVTVLLLALVVVLASILIGARYALNAALTVLGVLALLKFGETRGVIQPDWSWVADPTNGGTITGMGLVIVVIAIISWLFNVRMERSLRRAERAEAALQRQKRLLESIVQKRTRQLQAAQFEKVQELYRFAELGQISTALVHDLANHLTALTLDIEGLEAQNRSRVLQRAKRSMHYIDNMVARVRDQLKGKSAQRAFRVADEIDTVVHILRHTASQANVILKWQPDVQARKLRITGDPVRFRQLATNLIGNAIDAYDGVRSGADRRVHIVLQATSKQAVRLVVEDWGKGISPGDRSKLFEPFYSTKRSGMGLGLFIARQITEDLFGGTIRIDYAADHTVFQLTLKTKQ